MGDWEVRLRLGTGQQRLDAYWKHHYGESLRPPKWPLPPRKVKTRLQRTFTIGGRTYLDEDQAYEDLAWAVLDLAGPAYQDTYRGLASERPERSRYLAKLHARLARYLRFINQRIVYWEGRGTFNGNM